MSHLLQNFVILHLSLIYILLIIDTFKILYYFILITVILIVKFEKFVFQKEVNIGARFINVIIISEDNFYLLFYLS